MAKSAQPATPTIQLTIADQAALLRDAMPESARELARDIHTMNDIRDAQEKRYEFAPDLKAHREFYQQHLKKICEHYRSELMGLAALVFVELPEVALKLEHIRRIVPRWHDDPQFDWRPVQRELRLIEVAALQASANAGAVSNPTRDKKRIATPTTRPLNENMQRALKHLKKHGKKASPVGLHALALEAEVSEGRVRAWCKKDGHLFAYGVRNDGNKEGYYYDRTADLSLQRKSST